MKDLVKYISWFIMENILIFKTNTCNRTYFINRKYRSMMYVYGPKKIDN